jgi:hypothetical protein
VHPRLAQIVDPILRDVLATCGIELEILDEHTTVGPAPQLAFTVRDPSGIESEVSVPVDQELWQDIADAAEKMQEIIGEELWFESRPGAWPECPGHPRSHALEVAVQPGDVTGRVQSKAVWRCPMTHEIVAELGAHPAKP